MQKNLVLTRGQQHHRKPNKGRPASSPKTEKKGQPAKSPKTEQRSASIITKNRTKVHQHHHQRQNKGRPASSPKTEQRSASKIKYQRNVKFQLKELEKTETGAAILTLWLRRELQRDFYRLDIQLLHFNHHKNEPFCATTSRRLSSSVNFKFREIRI